MMNESWTATTEESKGNVYPTLGARVRPHLSTSNPKNQCNSDLVWVFLTNIGFSGIFFMAYYLYVTTAIELAPYSPNPLGRPLSSFGEALSIKG